MGEIRLKQGKLFTWIAFSRECLRRPFHVFRILVISDRILSNIHCMTSPAKRTSPIATEQNVSKYSIDERQAFVLRVLIG